MQPGESHDCDARRTLMRRLIQLAVVMSSGKVFPSESDFAKVTVRLCTVLGVIDLTLAAQQAPVTARNFLTYVAEQAYDGGSFYRNVTLASQRHGHVKIEVIQGGARKDASDHDPILLEPTSITGLKHLTGTISMARDTPNSATSDFFICINDQPELDFGGARNPDGQGFAAFGRVIRGMRVVRSIHAGHVNGDRLRPPIAIHKAIIMRN